ncbi:unnamed protein product, partial [Amoebophrya sp. A25]
PASGKAGAVVKSSTSSGSNANAVPDAKRKAAASPKKLTQVHHSSLTTPAGGKAAPMMKLVQP